jgi:regulator of nonsense transcripts 3
MSLSETVRQVNFEDAQNTWNSPALLGPPVVEFAPYGRIPSGRRRTDARQGTIDQDPEFMDFLESLANPISSKEPVGDVGVEGAIPKGEKVTITPLVQFLKDKKANKGKEAAAIKAAKQARQESATKSPAKSAKEASAPPEDTKKTSKDMKKERLVEKAAREAVKVLTREAAAKTAQETPKNPRAQARERGSIAAAARILQRDLGLSPVNAHRKAKADADNATKAEAYSLSSAVSTTPKPPAGPANKARGGRPENEKPQIVPKEPPTPITLLKKPAEVAAPTPAAPPTTPSTVASTAPTAPAAMPKATPSRKLQIAVPSTGTTRAFVKHANPSQGVTEPLLKEAMEVFGAVSYVEIDKRKGFAYVDFVDPEGLVKAMAANPTKIAQGTVQVLERKDPKPATREPPAGPARGGFQGRGRGTIGRRGGRGGGGGGGAASSNPAPSAAPASAPTGPAAGVK